MRQRSREPFSADILSELLSDSAKTETFASV